MSASASEEQKIFFPTSGDTLLHFIDGKFVPSVDGATLDVLNPFTEELVCKAAAGAKSDVDAAVDAAERAFPAWRDLAPKLRCDLLYKLSDKLQQHRVAVGALEVLDTGKPVAEADACDLQESIDTLRYFAGSTDKIVGSVANMEQPFFSYTRREPLGVVGLIVPWNYPLLMCVWKLAPALACGNTVVLKPAEQTVLTTNLLARFASEVGFPAGVFNVVQGLGETAGDAISSHPKIVKVSFTGSVEVGRIVLGRSASTNLKRVTLELGGKSPLIIMDDANLDKAVPAAWGAAFANAAQNCTAGSRLFLHSAIHDKFVEAFVEYNRTHTVMNNPFDPATNIGSLIEAGALARVLGYIESAKAEGATVAAGGSRRGSKGFCVEPTILVNCTDAMRCVREEIFGPVVSVLKFDTFDEALARANDTPFGLASAIFTSSHALMHRFARESLAGTVWINTYNVNPCNVPFGGYKHSGIGKDLGPEALNEFTNTKTVTADTSF